MLFRSKLNASMEHPLSGLDPLSKGKTIIFGHPQVALKTIPSESDYPAIITTTGCLTEKTYTKTKQGLKATFNHSHSAVVLEIDSDGDTHIRHLNFDGEGFYDFDKFYTPNTTIEDEDFQIEAIITGDEHVLFGDENVADATYYNDDSIVKTLKPKKIVRHDVLDAYSVSHHHKHNVFTKYAKFKEGVSSIQAELHETIDYILDTTPEYSQSIIVSSNHNDHLKKWLNECNPEFEPWNAEIYHWFMWKMLSRTQMGPSGAESPNPFELYTKEYYKENFCIPGQEKGIDEIIFLGRNDHYKIGDVSVSHHGDVGLNGSRGSRA